MANSRQFMAARTGAWAKIGGGVPTARDYIQDGIVLLIDGIENDGFGVHSDSVSVWKNLATSGIMSDVSLSGDYSIESNNIRMNHLAVSNRTSNGIGRCDVVQPFSTKTIEVCSSGFVPNHVTDVKRKNAFFSGPNTFGTLYFSTGNIDKANSIIITLYTTRVDSAFIFGGLPNFTREQCQNFRTISYNSSKSLVVDQEDLSSEVATDTSSDMYSGEVELFNRSSDWSRPFNGKIHCMRVYDRNLTAEEMIANQAIDNARFNLT